MNDFKIPKYTEQVIPQVENLFKSLFLIGIVIGDFFLAPAGVNAIDSYFLDTPSWLHFVLRWAFVIVLALFNGVVLMGLGMLGHEATHRIFFKNMFWNDLWGGICWALLLFPFYSFREFHLTHHGHTHQPGADPEELMNNHSVWKAIVVGPPTGLYITSKIVVTNLFGRTWEQRYRGLKDVLFLSFGLAFYFYIVPLAGLSLSYTSIPTILLMPYVFAFRHVSEHHAIPSYVRKSIKQAENLSEELNIDSWIVLTTPFMDWIWSNINYHQVHHRYPYLSHRYLKQVFEATKDEQPYIVVKGYFRSLMNSSRWKYYGNYEDLKPFLTTRCAAKS